MRNLVSAYRSRLLGQAAAIAIIAGFGAGCSDATHPGEPFFTGSTANQREIIGSATAQPMPGPIPPGAVTSSNLPPPPGAVASAAPYAPPPGAVPGPGWTAVGGKVVTVGPGESLDTLAIKYGVPSAQIARTNGISSPSQITAGRTLIIPQPTGQAAAYAAAEPLPSPGAAAPAARTTVIAVKGGDVVHVVQPGETLYGIAKASGVNAQDIVALNGMSSETVRIGQKLRMPNGALPKAQVASAKTETQVATLGAPPKPLGTLTVKPGGQAVASAPAAAAVPAAPAATDLPSAPSAAKAPTTIAAAAVDDATEPPSANGTTFRWPVRGRIISGFGVKANGERNDGINLAVPEGTAVKAAEAGTVIYAGNELAGYGNLVLIRHADGWVSAYAHNSQILVKRGDVVKRGQTVAQAGMSGSVTAPQVHFELRKGAKPVNPLDYLADA